ncbi:MAG: hypothetical protein QNJ73_13435 [Gammaproteobacteria bacterium]|nr:hypothetical protein [Gammaproteobacteria bacterium]
MRRVERAFLKIVGVTTAAVGAFLVSWEAVTIYYLWTGRIQAGEEHPPLPLAAGLFIFGLVLLIAGYWVQRRTIVRK